MATHPTPCPDGMLPVHYAPPVDPALLVWHVEGRITDFNPRPGSTSPRNITANGMLLQVPPGLLIKTISLDQTVGNVEFGEDNDPALLDLLDPDLERARSIIGGTVIAGGTTEYTTEAGGTCVKFVADSIFVELAENGLIGPLMNGDTTDGSFVVSGATIRMNTDPRFPSVLLDIGGNPITIDNLAGHEGALMDVGGYYAPDGVLYGTAVQADVISTQEGKDTVIVEKVQVQRARLRVVGLVSKHFDAQANAEVYPATLDVYAGSIAVDGSGCAGTLLGEAQVDPLDGTFDFRLENVSPVPTRVCVGSDFGGVDDADVIIK